MVHNWIAAAAVYLDRRVGVVLLLGFASGLPLALTGATLSVWLAESGLKLTAIGLFSLVGLPYSLKFLWAPLIDRLPLPVLDRCFGRRRAWGLASQLCLMLALIGLGLTDPRSDPWWTACLAVVVAFCSASQDIVIDAYRVESLEPHQFGAGAATYVLGYRFGMLASGAGALYLASALPWREVYFAMAALVLVGMATLLLSGEPAAKVRRDRAQGQGVGAWLYGAVVAPFTDFMSRPAWAIVLGFIVVFKLGDVLVGVMAMPFYLDLGFSKIEIANVTKLFGLLATIAGGFIGGALVHRLGIMRGVLVCGVLQMVSNLTFAVLAMVGHDLGMLMVTVTIENICGGMATAAFVAYLSSLCSVAYTATQYALLSSLFAFSRDVLGASGGWFSGQLGWVGYFVLCTAAALPGLALFLVLCGRSLAPQPVAAPIEAVPEHP
ncbi:MAG: MFS transporter [Azospirillum sp.]|nr:MFS transporter [Azospirillum sp.]